VDSLIVLINDELKKLCDWLKANKLSINIKKTNFMLFCNFKADRTKLASSIFIGNCAIDLVLVSKFLGLQIDSKLTCKNHISEICLKFLEVSV